MNRIVNPWEGSWDSEDQAQGEQERGGVGILETAKGKLPLKSLEVKAQVLGLHTEMVVRQTFVNTYNEPLEATYIFPLPDRAAATSFRLKVAGRVVEGKLKERGQARQEYRQAIQQGHRAALAEEDRPGTFTMQVGNLPPGEQAEVELSLVGPLVYRDGEAEFRFPLVVAPRYVPGSPLDGPSVGKGWAVDTDQVPDASRVTPPVLLPGFPNPVQLSLEVLFQPAGLQPPPEGWAAALKSSLHTLVVDDVAEGQPLTLRLQPGERLNRDFILRFPVARQNVQTTLNTATTSGSSVFSLTLAPALLPPGSVKPRDVVFVLDRSGSMEGWKMVAARRALGRMIDTLTEHDTFAVLAFDNQIELPPHAGSTLQPATNRQRWQTLEWLGKVDSRGGTEMGPALNQAMQMLQTQAASAPQRQADPMLVFVTDGQVSGEDVLLRTLKTSAKSQKLPRIFALGIDRAVNAGFLNRLAKLGGGMCELVETEDRLDEVMQRVHRLIATPALTDLKLEALGGQWEADSLTPALLPDLFCEAPAIVYGRFTSDPAEFRLRITAKTSAGKPWSVEVSPTPLPAAEKSRPHPLLSFWGRARIRDLEDQHACGQRHLSPQIIQTSLETQVLSRFTAYVAVDSAEVVNPGGQQIQVVQPVEQPEGFAMLQHRPMANLCANMPLDAAASSVLRGSMMASAASADEDVVESFLCEFEAPPPPSPGTHLWSSAPSPAKPQPKQRARSLFKAERTQERLANFADAPAPDRSPKLLAKALQLVEKLQATTWRMPLRYRLRKLLRVLEVLMQQTHFDSLLHHQQVGLKMLLAWRGSPGLTLKPEQWAHWLQQLHAELTRLSNPTAGPPAANAPHVKPTAETAKSPREDFWT